MCPQAPGRVRVRRCGMPIRQSGHTSGARAWARAISWLSGREGVLRAVMNHVGEDGREVELPSG